MPVRRVADIVKLHKQNTLSLIGREFGQIKLRALLSVILIDLVDFLEVGKKMGEQQIVQTVLLIEQEYYYLTIEDFKVCFDRGKCGGYGQLFDRIDGSVILGWLDQYAAERSNAFANHNDAKGFLNQDRFVRRGDTVKICDREIGVALKQFKH